MIDNRQDRIIWSIGWQSGDEIQGRLLEWERVVCRGDAVEGNACSMGDIFVLLTYRTSRNVVLDPGAHPWPPVRMGDLGEGFISAGMAGGWGVMQQLQDFVFERLIRGNRQASFFLPAVLLFADFFAE